MESTPLQRVKGRLPNQLREISCEQGIITRADGSARLITVGIYGPLKATFSKDEDSENAVINVIYRKAKGQSGTSESEKQQFIKKTFEDAIFRSVYPRMEITIDIQVLSDDGSSLSAAINAVQLGLMNSGISMKYMVSSISMCYKYDKLYLDPSLSEEQNTNGGGVFVIPSNEKNSIISCLTYGLLSEEDFIEMFDSAIIGVEKYFEFYRLCIH